MIKYIIISSADTLTFHDEVNKLIEKGYVPSGGVSVSYNGAFSVYNQAMILKSAL